MSQLTLVAGAGGFIGGQLVRDLLAKGIRVRAVDKKRLEDWYFLSNKADKDKLQTVLVLEDNAIFSRRFGRERDN